MIRDPAKKSSAGCTSPQMFAETSSAAAEIEGVEPMGCSATSRCGAAVWEGKRYYPIATTASCTSEAHGLECLPIQDFT